MEDLVLEGIGSGEAAQALEILAPREREVLRRRLGLDGEPETLDAIGDTIGVTRERVRQIETEALKRLKEVVRL
jgi:RNA polymerase nonessential primary-like sigma factor